MCLHHSTELKIVVHRPDYKSPSNLDFNLPLVSPIYITPQIPIVLPSNIFIVIFILLFSSEYKQEITWFCNTVE